MKATLKNMQSLTFNSVNKSMLIIYTAAPTTRIVAFKRLGLAQTFKGRPKQKQALKIPCSSQSQVKYDIFAPMRYRHLFFDLDHTLWDFDSNARITLAQIYNELELAKHGVNDFESFLRIYLANNEKLWSRFRKGFIKAEELRWKRMWHTLLEFGVTNEELARTMGGRFLELLPTRNILFPDTISTLEQLRSKGYTLHLITNGFEATQHNKLRNSGLAGFFTEVVTSEGSNSMKPKKEIFDFALQKAKALHEESIMIGDCLESDIQGAMNAGIDQVYMNHNNLPCPLNPTYTVYSIPGLQNIF